MHDVTIRGDIEPGEVPELRAAVGWERRDADYPELFRRCVSWASVRGHDGRLMAFAHLAGTGLQHGYIEDVIVHPQQRRLGLGSAVVRALLREAAELSIEMVTVTYAQEHRAFYEHCGFRYCAGGLRTTSVSRPY